MKNIKAVIFDMDGLMVDTEPLSLRAFNLIFAKYGKQLSDEDNNNLYVGLSDTDATEDMVRRYKLPISPKELAFAKHQVYQQILEKEVLPQPGLQDLLLRLRNTGYKTAIASGSLLEEIEIVINKLKIAKFIDAYCSASQVKNGKPAPDIFLKAAEKLGMEASECLVLEDAPKGVEAAKAAGMTCFAIPSKETKGQNFGGADRVLNSLSVVFNLL